MGRMRHLARRRNLNASGLQLGRPGAAAITVRALVQLDRNTVCRFFGSAYISERGPVVQPGRVKGRRRMLWCCWVM